MRPLHKCFQQVELAGGEVLVVAAVRLFRLRRLIVQNPPFERIALASRCGWSVEVARRSTARIRATSSLSSNGLAR